MKNKILACLIVLFAASFAKAGEFDFLLNPVKINPAFVNNYEANIKAGYLFSGYFSAGEEFQDLDFANSFSFSGEYFYYLNVYSAIGAGASYQIISDVKDLGLKAGFAPVYFSLKIRSWPQQPGIYGYIFGQIGYNFFYGNYDNYKINGGGLYYSYGFGIDYKKCIFEIMYAVYSGKICDLQNDSKDTDVSANQIIFSLGYRF